MADPTLITRTKKLEPTTGTEMWPRIMLLTAETEDGTIDLRFTEKALEQLPANQSIRRASRRRTRRKLTDETRPKPMR